ncbi:MAG: conserved membrane protein of unknown function [Promethearchaeota archaeon]|nr:MAG: conserved membrane protein of unknown function [Candidatus Lokiarchaeota archaeon]
MAIKKNAYYIIGGILALFSWITILCVLTPFKSIFDVFVRLGVLLGFTCLFLATFTTPFMKQLYQLFGKPFMTLHHYFSISGLVLITLHPVFFAIEVGSIGVFIPRFDSWIVFWELAGRPALYIIYIAVLAVLIRKSISPKLWRALHGLNYIGLFFAYIHGLLIGTDFKNPGIFITFTIMIVLVGVALLYKRYLKYRLQKKMQSKRSE